MRTQALPAPALRGSARVAWSGRALLFSPGIVKRALVAVTPSAQPMDATETICHSSMPFGAGSGVAVFTFWTSTPQTQIS
jgi:hypothetical protein